MRTTPLFAIALTTMIGCVTRNESLSNNYDSNWLSQYYVTPPISDYYPGESTDFSIYAPSDPQGRKFRIAYIRVICKQCKNPEMAKQVIEHAAAGFALSYMGLREQNASNYHSEGSLLQAFRGNAKAAMKYDEAVVKSYLDSPNQLIDAYYDYLHHFKNRTRRDGMTYSLGREGRSWKVDRCDFIKLRHNIQDLNMALEALYPHLFSTEESAFPLDVLLVMACNRDEKPPMKAISEAWLIGLPEHANLVGNEYYNDGKLFPAERGWLSPYEATAAALFKLTSEQWDGLEPANPYDHSWIK